MPRGRRSSHRQEVSEDESDKEWKPDPGGQSPRHSKASKLPALTEEQIKARFEGMWPRKSTWHCMSHYQLWI